MQPEPSALALVTLAFAVNLPSGAWASVGVHSHLLDLEQASKLVENVALRRAGRDADRQRIDIDGEGMRIEARVNCRRSGDHAARCAWRSFVYVGPEASDPRMTCSGVARVTLVGSDLRMRWAGGRCFW